MKSWQLSVVGLACLVAAGCRTDPNIVLLERELRLQEDEIYRLRGVVEDYQAALRSRGVDAAGPGGSRPADAGPSRLLEMIRPRDIPGAEEERGSPPGDDGYGDRESEAPASPYEVPSRPSPGGEQPDGPSADEPGQGPSDLEPSVPDPPAEKGVGDGTEVRRTGAVEPVFPADSRQVARLALNRLLTGGYDSDGRPGDDGIVVAIEPRDAQGRSLKAAAEVSVVVLDPALDGEAARVARWDFTAAETAARFRRSVSGGAIHLELPWPADPPVHGQLYLFVRYTTSDGRRLQAEGPIQIGLPGRTSRRWVRSQPAPPAPEAGRPADLGEPDQAEPGRIRLGPALRMPTSLSPSPGAGPAGPKIEPPVWSPHRR